MHMKLSVQDAPSPDEKRIREMRKQFPGRHFTIHQRARGVCRRLKKGQPQTFEIVRPITQPRKCPFCGTWLEGAIPIVENERRWRSEDEEESAV